MTDDFKKRKIYLFLLVLVICSGAAFQGWRTLLNNFAVEVAGLNGLDMGVVQSVREVPGFLALLAIYMILFISEHRLAALSVVILGVGVGLTGFLPTLSGLVFTTLLMSFGFHYYETMNQSLTLQYFSHTEAPVVMGRLRSVNALTNVTVGGAIYFLARVLGYTEMFALLGRRGRCRRAVVPDPRPVEQGPAAPAQEDDLPQPVLAVLRPDLPLRRGGGRYSWPSPCSCWSPSSATPSSRSPPCSWPTTSSTTSPTRSSGGPSTGSASAPC